MGLIDIQSFSRHYGATSAVRDLHLTVEQGERFGLLGPDGAGKTTTLRSVVSLLPIQQGSITVQGHDVSRHPRTIRSLVGYMPQRFSLYPDLSVEQNLRFFADLFSVPARDADRRMERLYRFSRLEPFRHRLAGRLSGGMKQKLALSCTLMHDPTVLVLDEPTTGVDPVSRVEFWDILSDLRSEGVTQLISTPYMDEALLCDRIGILHEGRLLALGTPASLRAEYPSVLCAVRGDHLPLPLLRAQTSIRSVQMFGDSLHVAARPGVSSHQLTTLLLDLLPPTVSVYPVEPSLEDVFIDLIEHATPSAEETSHD